MRLFDSSEHYPLHQETVDPLPPPQHLSCQQLFPPVDRTVSYEYIPVRVPRLPEAASGTHPQQSILAHGSHRTPPEILPHSKLPPAPSLDVGSGSMSDRLR